jgi:hypothetical protein
VSNEYDPKAKYLEQPWHTVTTLRELAREQDALITQLYAERGAHDAIALIDRTPQAYRIFGAISHYIALGFDADHIIQWLERGEASGVARALNKKMTVEVLKVGAALRNLLTALESQRNAHDAMLRGDAESDLDYIAACANVVVREKEARAVMQSEGTV